jgi:Na+/H+ antiporter NhaD/arsenite permease-like protein
MTASPHSAPSSTSYRWKAALGSRSAVIGLLTAGALALVFWLIPAPAGDFEPELARIRAGLPLWTAIPFAGMLLSIALFPLLAPSFWHHHFKKVAIAWAFALAGPWLVQFSTLGLFVLLETLLLDYVPFLILLWGLYTVSGGIMLRAKLVATPGLNVAFLVVGTILASLMGTTGAAMLLIRPLLRANAWRKNNAHVFVFFIFLVANVGGLLTPLGDPPLFLGFLRGVPFFWTMNLLPEYALTAVLLVVVFYVIDRYLMAKELHLRPSHDVPHRRESFAVAGAHNFVLLFGILGAVLLSGFWHTPSFQWFGIHLSYNNLLRDLAIVAIGLVSIASTPTLLREENGFTWDAIKEVAYLFFGIFVTIIPALAILRAGTDGSLGWMIASIREPWQYFWMSGALSSFLDNAPTYLTFMTLALGQLGIEPSQVNGILTGALSVDVGPTFMAALKAVSAGAVFMGANTYIGNAPNFMVLSIAKEHGVKMPSFFGYMLWSGAILIPTFIVVTLVFF